MFLIFVPYAYIITHPQTWFGRPKIYNYTIEIIAVIWNPNVCIGYSEHRFANFPIPSCYMIMYEDLNQSADCNGDCN